MDAVHPTSAPPRFAVLIPAYDCAATIAAVVEGARAGGLGEVLVVDDGSHDDTAARAAAAGATVLRLAPNRGKGAALRAGLVALAQRGATHALSMDGDGQHLARDLPALRAARRAAPAALIIGARRIGTQQVKPIKLFGNRFANRWVEIACGVALPDSQSGLRVYPIAATLGLGARADRFAFETEVLIRAARAGIAIESVPVDVYYPPPEERVSHYAPLRDTLRIIAVVLRLILWR
ncbi:MAG: glycosyltransferase family 2 protein [Deltaproteobacteria bacterium]|nr:glycosyltransferase family 2 protein [Deltaproteobacteria bacterium]